MTCDTCKKKDTCKELCEDAEKYVGQDNTPKSQRGRDVIYSLNFIAHWTSTGIDLEEIAERKKDELVFYFQKIQDMPRGLEKAILAMIYFEIPMNDIAKYLKISRQAVSERLRNLT